MLELEADSKYLEAERERRHLETLKQRYHYNLLLQYSNEYLRQMDGRLANLNAMHSEDIQVFFNMVQQHQVQPSRLAFDIFSVLDQDNLHIFPISSVL